MKYYYRTRDRPQLPFKSTIPEERREQLINTIKKVIAVLLVFTVIVLAACSVDLSPVKAAEIGNSVNLDGYGEYISNDELGELVSYGGYISKREYAAQLSDNSVGASYNPRFAGCYDTNGYQITVRRAMAGQYVGESALMIYVNGSRAYCIQPGAALNTGSSLTQTTSCGVWASLSANQKEAVNVALCYGREGNFSNIKGSSSINSDQCYIATQLIIWEIINGERNPTAPYSLKGNGYLSMYCTDGHNGNIANAYHKIESAMASAKAIPSFAGKSSSDAPLYTLNATYNNIKKTWSYTPLTLTDSNSVLSQFIGFNNKTLDVGNATVTVKVSGNKITLTPSAGKLNATSKEVILQSSKSGVPKSDETKLIAYASSYQDVVSGGSVSAPSAYFTVRVTVTENAKLDYDFHVRKVIGTQNEYDNCDGDVIDGVVSTSENLKGWYFRVEVSNVSTFYRYYNVRSFILGPTDEAGRTQTVGEYVMEHFNYSNVSSLVPTDYYEVTELGRKVGSEYVMPDFYKPDRTIHSFLFSPGSLSHENAVISECYYSNIFSIPLEIIKTTDDGSRTTNYYFQAVNNDTNEEYTLHVTANGTFCRGYQTRTSEGRYYVILPEGKYTLTELGIRQTGGGYVIPERFVQPTPIEFEVTADAYKKAFENGQQAITVTVENKCEGKIKLRKTEEGGDQPVAGAVYGLFSDEDCLNLIYTFPETDGNGETETADKYPCGEQFYVKEIETPASYELSDTVYPVTIEAKEDGEIAYVLAVTDKKLPTRIQVIKVDEKSNPLAGVQLQVLDSSGNIIIPTWTTDGKPYEITGKLEVGQTYKLHEVKTLTEYTLSKDVSFTVKDTTDVQTVRMINRKKTGQVVIQKLDGDGKALVGAQWIIYDSNGNAVRFYRISEGLYTYTSSGSNLTLSSSIPSLTAMNLPLGEYYLIEETAPNSKMANGKKIPFSIKPDSTETLNRTITVKDNNIIIPNTGSNGKALCYAAGLFSFAAALAAFTYYKKRKTINHAPDKGAFSI